MLANTGSSARLRAPDGALVHGSRALGALIGVVARIVTGPHAAHRQDPHLSRRYDTGRPRAVIRVRIAQPRTTSLPCPAGLRARRPSPIMSWTCIGSTCSPPGPDDGTLTPSSSGAGQASSPP